MQARLKQFIKRWLTQTPYDVRLHLPEATLQPLALLLAAFARGERISTILQVGACDGSTNDPLRHYLQVARVRAVLIEPNPYAFARLQTAYAGIENVTLLQAAIADEDGETDLYRVKKLAGPESEVDLDLQVSSFYREHLVRHGKRPQDIEKIRVATRTLRSLVNEFDIERVDLLQIDAEGFDAAVVRMAMGMDVQPDCISFEHFHLRDEERRPIFALLRRNGYLLGYDTYNILAIRSSVMEQLKQTGALSTS